jgi:hypothetical protein
LIERARARPPPPCSALAKAGKTVLLIEAADLYGAGWASHSASSFPPLLHLRQQQGAAAAAPTPDPAAAGQAPPPPAADGADGDGFTRIPLRPAQSDITGVALYTSSQCQMDDKQLILDLCPKVSLLPPHAGVDPCRPAQPRA